jgi:mannosylglycoprotein endo-beta-mannosidase
MFLNRIQELDATSDNQGLNEEGWALRYHLEDQLTSILSTEEEYWRQRGRQQWVLKGDANTKYFHAMANGRRQNCAIVALNSASGLVTDKEAIQEMIYSFYLDLMGAEEPKLLSLDSDIWPL